MQVTVTIKTTPQHFAEGTVAGNWRVTAVSAADPDTIVSTFEGPDPTAAFDLPNGTYVFRAERLDAEGTPIGRAAQTQLVVDDSPVMVDVPAAVTAATVLT